MRRRLGELRRMWLVHRAQQQGLLVPPSYGAGTEREAWRSGYLAALRDVAMGRLR